MIIKSKNVGVKILPLGNLSKVVNKEILSNQLLYRFIPDLKIKEKGKSNITLKIKEGGKKGITFSSATPEITGIYGTDFNSTDIIVVAEYLLEKLRQENNFGTIHSSAVYKKKSGILLIGNLTGIGKTSTSIKLSRDYNFNIYSDEKTILNFDTFEMAGQTKAVWLCKKTEKALGLKQTKKIKITKTKDISILLFIIPMVISNCKNVKVIKYSKPQFKWMLYEEISKDIRAINGLVFNFTYPLSSLDTQILSKKRETFAEKVSQEIPCYLIQGPLMDVSTKINQLFEQSLSLS